MRKGKGSCARIGQPRYRTLDPDTRKCVSRKGTEANEGATLLTDLYRGSPSQTAPPRDGCLLLMSGPLGPVSIEMFNSAACPPSIELCLVDPVGLMT